jgi:hypothetical protein
LCWLLSGQSARETFIVGIELIRAVVHGVVIGGVVGIEVIASIIIAAEE